MGFLLGLFENTRRLRRGGGLFCLQGVNGAGWHCISAFLFIYWFPSSASAAAAVSRLGDLSRTAWHRVCGFGGRLDGRFDGSRSAAWDCHCLVSRRVTSYGAQSKAGLIHARRGKVHALMRDGHDLHSGGSGRWTLTWWTPTYPSVSCLHGVEDPESLGRRVRARLASWRSGGWV